MLNDGSLMPRSSYPWPLAVSDPNGRIDPTNIRRSAASRSTGSSQVATGNRASASVRMVISSPRNGAERLGNRL